MAKAKGTQKGGTQKRVDWDAMLPEFLDGKLSNRKLAEKYGCNEGSIRKHFKKLDISRDHSKVIKAKADKKVRTTEVRSKVRTQA